MMLSNIGAFDAKNTLGSLLDRVQEGEEIVITRHGKPVARLVPHNRTQDREQDALILARMRQRAKSLRLSFDWNTIKAERDEGRL